MPEHKWAELSDEEKNILVRKCAGWTSKMLNTGIHHQKELCWHEPGGNGWMVPGSSFPDYVNDLNSIHNVISKLSSVDYACYGDNLEVVVGFDSNTKLWSEYRKLIEATSDQQSEAFVLTMEKLNESNGS